MSGSGEIVLVTGATGFVGSHVINVLLQQGWKVRGTVRDLTSKKTKAVQEIFAPYKDQLELVVADLKSPDDWPAALKGCTYVHHIAAPVEASAFNTPDMKYLKDAKEVKKVVDMVAESTRFVVEKAIAAGVKRFINTSSIAAMIPAGWAESMYPIKDVPGAHNPNLDFSKTIQEDVWTDESLVDGYLLAKTRSEKAAWEAVKGSSMEMVCVNPCYILGPQLHKLICADSVGVIDGFMLQSPGGSLSCCGMYMWPSMCMACVDVRDVAKVHVESMTSPKAAGNRYFVTNGTMDCWDIMDVLKEEFQPMGYQTVTIKAPKWLVGLRALVDVRAKRVTAVWGKYPAVNNQKVIRDFGALIDKRTAIIDTVLSAVAVRRYERRPGFKTDKPEYQELGKDFVSLKVASASSSSK